MPPRTLAPCLEPRCPELTRSGRCDEHRRQSERRRGSAASRGYDRKWRLIRGSYLKQHPICERADCLEDATDVHHLDGRGPSGDNSWKNLEALCHSHHSQVTGRNQSAGRPA